MSIQNIKDVMALQIKAGDLQTPYIILDKEQIRNNCKEYIHEFKKGCVFFSVKANSHLEVIKTLFEEGICFDVASWGEVELLDQCHVPADRIIFSAPTKIPEHIQKAYEFGIRVFAFDSEIELEKLSRLAPGSKIVARLIVKNTGSDWPLEKKFGMNDEDAISLMIHAKKMGLIPYGLTFHVGSQNSRPDSWREALAQAGEVAHQLYKKGIHIKMVNAGGGFPAQYSKEIPELALITKAIKEAGKQYVRKDVLLFVEPGRGLTANAGVIVTTVINRTVRNGENWLYVDAGIFHGMYEAREGFRFPILTKRDKDPKSEFTVAGPSCDSVDIIMENVSMPSTLDYGDNVYFLTTGAYTNSMERYNGIDFPGVVPNRLIISGSGR